MTEGVTPTEIEPKGVREIGTDPNYKHEVLWYQVAFFLSVHVLGLFGLLLAFVDASKWTTIFALLYGFAGNEGVTIGAHRLYAHRSFKARPLLRSVLVALQTVSGQNSVLTWVRDHRLHHQYSDTDLDPHNIRRGFFFSHIGWLLCRKHPAIREIGRLLDVSDVQADPIVRFQKKYYLVLYAILSIALPVAVPMLYWNESLLNSLMICYFMRWTFSLNSAFSSNSLAHTYGTRPYDRKLLPAETWLVSLVTLGEGWHNYHHAFPWDYKASEHGMPLNLTATIIDLCAKLGLVYDLKEVRLWKLHPAESWFVAMVSLGEGWHNYHHAFPWDYRASECGMPFNASTAIIDLCAKLGLAYDLKAASPLVLEKRIARTGDGTHHALGDETARKNVTAAYGVLVHPLNPTYRTASDISHLDTRI